MLVAPFNDAAALSRVLAEHADEVAAVIVEPLQRSTLPAPGFLEAAREAGTTSGVLLIFDEVVTGFRLAYGGAQEYYGVGPDLVAYREALGGGYPIRAFAGAAEVMERVSERGSHRRRRLRVDGLHPRRQSDLRRRGARPSACCASPTCTGACTRWGTTCARRCARCCGAAGWSDR